MLETGSPLEDAPEELNSAVSPPSSHHTSRSSTPGISCFDGTPLYLFPFSTPPRSLSSASFPHDMAIKAARRPDVDRQEPAVTPNAGRTKHRGTQVASHGFAQESRLDPSDAQDTGLKSAPSLPELTRLLRTESFQRRKCRQIQQQVYSVSIIAARTARLAHTARSVQRTLAECIRSEDKQSFVNLFNAFNDSLSESFEPPKGTQEDGQVHHESSHGYPASFLDALSVDTRTTLLAFLARIRQDGDFIADRLAALSHQELVALLPGKGLSVSDNSIFGSSPRSSLRTSKHLGFVVDSQTELLSSHDFASPLEVLVHSVRGISGTHLEDNAITMDVWATVCARLISEQRPGVEKLVPAVLDIWASSSSWIGKERLEIWLLQTVQKGSFLLDQTQKPSFRVRIQGRQESNPLDDDRLEVFYVNAVDSLLQLLVDPSGASAIPECVLKLCSMICNKLRRSPRHQRFFPNFVITRWLFSTFLLDTIALPEMHGMLSDYFVPDNVRQRILREVAGRCQKSVFDVTYSWKYGGPVSEEKAQFVTKLADKFQQPWSGCTPVASENVQIMQSWPEDDTFVSLSAGDISTLVNALYPSRRPPSLSDRDLSHSGLQSSASSISGFSLFQSIGAFDSFLSQPSSCALDTASQMDGEPAYSVDPARDAISDSSSLIMQTESDGQRLREACLAIEDHLTRGRPTPSDQWCVLVVDATTKCLATLHEKLLEPTMKKGSAKDSRPLSPTHNACSNVIEELLEAGDLSQVRESLTGSRDLPAVLLQTIVEALKQRVERYEHVADFAAAHSYFRKIRHFNDLSTDDRHPQNLAALLRRLESDKQRALDITSSVMESCDTFTRSLTPCVESQSQELLAFKDAMGRLRIKMWYVADVRTSAIYDEARSVALALRAMAKPQQSARTRLAQSTRNGNGARASTTSFQFKTEAQILELISAPPEHGGRNKLSDDHSKGLVTWMERNAIENFCRAEERLHKFCMEVRKATDHITAEASPLRSSTLFLRDELRPPFMQRPKHRDPFWSLHDDRKRLDMLTLHTDIKPSQDTVSSGSSHPLSTKSSRDYLESWSPSVTNQSSATFWSPVTTEARSPSSVTSIGSSQTQGALLFSSDKPVKALTDQYRNSSEYLRQYIISLLLSDFGSTLFGNGSETDHAIWAGIGGELTEKYLRNLYQDDTSSGYDVAEQSSFDFEKAFKDLTTRLSASCNPFMKLKRLADMDALLTPYMTGLAIWKPSTPATELPTLAKDTLSQLPKSSVTDVKVEGFKRLFKSKLTRPEAIFRDLQYIAALVPSPTLETTPQGKAFWNAAAAISSLKRGACNIMLETADSIIAHHSNNRGHGRSPSVAQRERDSAAFPVPTSSPSPEDINGRSMSDAAALLRITAREGYPVAQRELATLYLTHPELMEHIIAPFSRPRDVFKEELESKWRKNQDPARCDPATMCVAHHWMSLSSKGGDALATEFLRQREEMERLP